MSEDGSNGYEGIARLYIAGRGTRPALGGAIGAATVRGWARAFPPGATVLDLGSGPGEPSTRVLQEAGLATCAVDASSAMVAAFRERFPGVPIEHNTAEASAFFGRTFDGVLAWGLMFLLEPAAQARVIEKVASALVPGGRFLFTAPREPLQWLDAMTGRPSQSLGAHVYQRLLRDVGLTWVADAQDEGENHYCFAERRPPSRGAGGHRHRPWITHPSFACAPHHVSTSFADSSQKTPYPSCRRYRHQSGQHGPPHGNLGSRLREWRRDCGSRDVRR